MPGALNHYRKAENRLLEHGLIALVAPAQPVEDAGWPGVPSRGPRRESRDGSPPRTRRWCIGNARIATAHPRKLAPRPGAVQRPRRDGAVLPLRRAPARSLAAK